MCISRSVGHSGKNDFVDVKVVQTLINLNRARFTPPVPKKLEMDGLIGAKTIDAIQRFETQVMGLAESDGIVAPGDATMRALIAGVPAGLSAEKLAAIMPHATAKNIARYFQPLVDAMPKYEIASELRMAHFLAQIGHESGSLRFSEELASGEAYEGRIDLGNTRAGDGKRFKGRGLIQLTGRANYQSYSSATGIDYIKNPALLSTDADAAVDVACWFWKTRGLNPLADADDARAVTKRINGGFNGLDDRISFLGRAKCLLRV